MFQNFDTRLFRDPSFKEDSVREVVIVPILNKLGYYAAGNQTVVRSKNLVQPFIYVGTRKHPVTIIPDYTLYNDGKPLLVLDAKSPTESLNLSAHIQQAYSYAVHPEIRANHFALCNGKRLVIYSVDNFSPLLDIPFEEFESRWDEIEKHLAPKYLINPKLRKLAPDFGLAILRLGMTKDAELIMPGARLNLVAKIADGQYTATVNTELAGKDHCVSFDFTSAQLPLIVAGLPNELRTQFLDAISRSPFKAAADLCIEVDLNVHLGDEIQLEHEKFVPLVIDEVYASRFNPFPPHIGGDDMPPHVFRLSKAFTTTKSGSDNT